MWMVFFLRNGDASHSDPRGSYDEALEAVRLGPSGASFTISFLDDENPEKDCVVLQGIVS